MAKVEPFIGKREDTQARQLVIINDFVGVEWNFISNYSVE